MKKRNKILLTILIIAIIIFVLFPNLLSVVSSVPRVYFRNGQEGTFARWNLEIHPVTDEPTPYNTHFKTLNMSFLNVWQGGNVALQNLRVADVLVPIHKSNSCTDTVCYWYTDDFSSIVNNYCAANTQVDDNSCVVPVILHNLRADSSSVIITVNELVDWSVEPVEQPATPNEEPVINNPDNNIDVIITEPPVTEQPSSNPTQDGATLNEKSFFDDVKGFFESIISWFKNFF